jgi:mannose-6-phosphate isomerase-like protein (cupin superfamily)
MAQREHEGTDRPEEWRVRTYDRWVADQGAPVISGLYIPDVRVAELGPWPAKGASGAIVRLIGSEDMTGAYILELAPGTSTEPQRHLYDELVHVVAGRGFTTVWNDRGDRTQFEWGDGALFAIPLNAHYQHHNASGSEPARFIATNNAPVYMNLIHNLDFVFNAPFDFTDRFSGDVRFDGETTDQGYRLWETNFVADVNQVPLVERPSRGGTNRQLELTNASIGAHLSEFTVGTYKKAHRHGAGTHIIITSGRGFSLMWREGEEIERVEWQPGSFIAPPDRWFHQHFNTGEAPSRYLALRYNSRKWGLFRQYGVDKSVKLGGDQIEYGDQEPWVHETFVAACAEHGVTVDMPQFAPSVG